MICPQCTNEVPVTEAQYLSMYTCGKCQAVYFIDITGQPEFGDMSAEMPVEEIVVEQNNSDYSQPETINNFGSDISNDLAAEVASEFENQLDHQMPQQPDVDFANQLNSDANPFEALSQNENSNSTSSFGQVAGEITDFANQDNSISALSYDLLITGLDSKETTALFKEAVEDTKFGWVSQDIFSQIKNGQFEFKNLNAVQAYVLAKRIQFLDIEMQWKQNVQI